MRALAASSILVFLLQAAIAAAQAEPAAGAVRVTMPERLGTLEFDRQNAFDDPALGVSVAYQGRGQTLTIYFYDYGVSGIPDGVDNDVVQEHYEQVKSDVLNSPSYQQAVFQREGRVRIGDSPDALTAMEAEFRIIRQVGQVSSSYLVLTGARGMFIKLRFSIAEGSELEATSNRHAILDGLASILPTIERVESAGGGDPP